MSNAEREEFETFLVEARELLAALEGDLLALEGAAGEGCRELVNAIFRSAHTLKGGAGFFGLEGMKRIAHAMESALNAVREGRAGHDRDLCSLLLAGADLLGRLLLEPGSADAPETEAVAAGLEEWLQRGAMGRSGGDGLPDLDPESLAAAQAEPPGGRRVYCIRFPAPGAAGSRPIAAIAEDLARFSRLAGARLGDMQARTWEELAAWTPAAGSRDPLSIVIATVIEPDLIADFVEVAPDGVRLLSADGAQPASGPPPALPSPVDSGSEGTSGVRRQAAPPAAPERLPAAAARADAGSIRVSTSHLDKLMSLAGELVLARNALLLSMSAGNGEDAAAVGQRIDGITSDLQEAIMATRMQPLEPVFGKFRRMVRDLSAALSKQIELRIEGGEVEVDKTIAEAIGDPLTHLIRNAADHGIEPPARRREGGKPPTGTIGLKAYHDAGQVVVEIRDDGAGIDAGRVRAKALETGLRSEAELARMGEKAVLMLIFSPGFSTAGSVTEISGRGVGMDVVQTNLARVGGTVDIDSTPGEGTLIRIKVPLTLAIIPGLLVAVGDERFAIPQANLAELVRIPASEAAVRLDRMGDALVLRSRGELLPVVPLGELLGIPPGSPAGGEGGDAGPPGRGPAQIAVVKAGECKYGILVDRLLDSAEIVVKPLSAHLAGCAEYAGATLLGDGRVALILDVNGLLAAAGLADSQARRAEAPGEAPDEDPSRFRETQSWLIVGDGAGERYGLPMGLVVRIERIAASSIQDVGGRRAIPYRQGSLVLLSLEGDDGAAPPGPPEQAFVIVFRVGGVEIGLLASEVVDAVHSDAAVDAAQYARPGILGAALLGGRIIRLVDLHALASSAVPGLAAPARPAGAPSATLLVVEDTPFFQRQFRLLLEEAGYEVIAAGNGLQGLEAMERHAGRISLVLTDIEMPVMDGYEMTRRLRSDPRHAGLPIIAVTSLSTADAERRGRSAGVTEYLIKLDRDQILQACSRHLHPGWTAAAQGGGMEPEGAGGRRLALHAMTTEPTPEERKTLP